MYTGPFLIVRCIEPFNYVLQKSVKSKPFVVHADKLKKKYFGETPKTWLNIVTDNTREDNSCEELQTSDVLPVRNKNKQPNTVLECENDNDEESNSESANREPMYGKRENPRKPRRFDDYFM